MTLPTVYVVTGANRGIGFALVNQIMKSHQDVIVYAGVRDPSKAQALHALEEKEKLRVVKLLSADEQSNKALARLIKKEVGYVDVVIANAGILKFIGSVIDTPPETTLEHFQTNFNGPLVLFQAMHGLLQDCPRTPKFVPISSAAGSIANFAPIPLGFLAYSTSKAALNYLAIKIHFENDWLVCFPLDPGGVKTASGKLSCVKYVKHGIVSRDSSAVLQAREMDKSGLLSQFQDQDQTARTPEDAAVALLEIVDRATRDDTSGKFVNVNSWKLSW